jgi:endonuclease YncB( thermonuclease family)
MQLGLGWVGNISRCVISTYLLSTSLAWGHELTGRVVNVTDGDTVTVLGAGRQTTKVRLMGIDAPERKQAFGTKAKEALAERVAGQDVTVIWKKRDRYGRIIGKIMMGSRDIDLEMVETGMAWHYANFAKEQEPADRTKYAGAEYAARSAKLGLWVDASPIAPWEFRKARTHARAIAKP